MKTRVHTCQIRSVGPSEQSPFALTSRDTDVERHFAPQVSRFCLQTCAQSARNSAVRRSVRTWLDRCLAWIRHWSKDCGFARSETRVFQFSESIIPLSLFLTQRLQTHMLLLCLSQPYRSLAISSNTLLHHEPCALATRLARVECSHASRVRAVSGPNRLRQMILTCSVLLVMHAFGNKLVLASRRGEPANTRSVRANSTSRRGCQVTPENTSCESRCHRVQVAVYSV